MSEPQTFDPSKPFDLVDTPPPPASREAARAALGESLPRFKPLPEKLQRAATEPLVHLTGNPTIDSLTSPLNIVLTATLGARSAAKALAAGAEAIGAGVDSELVSKTLKFLTPTKFKEGLDLLTTLAKKAEPPTVAAPSPAVPVEPIVAGPAAPAVPAAPVTPAAAPPQPAASAPSPVAAPPASPLPDQRALNEAALAVRRAAYQARMSSAPPVEAAPAPAPVAGNVKLTAAETKAFLNLTQRGMPGPDAMKNVLMQRSLVESLGTPTPTAAETRFPKGMRGKSTP